jgi:DNA-binding IclR family transcriptional regulator
MRVACPGVRKRSAERNHCTRFSALSHRLDPYRSVACELLTLLDDFGRPMTLRELEDEGTLPAGAAARQLSVARVAGFVRMSGATTDGELELRYEPTRLGRQIARRRRDTSPIAA